MFLLPLKTATLSTQPTVRTPSTASGTASTTARCRRWPTTTCASRRPTSSSTSGGRPSPPGRPTAPWQVGIRSRSLMIKTAPCFLTYLWTPFVQVRPVRLCATTGSTGCPAVGLPAWPPEPRPEEPPWRRWPSLWSFQPSAMKTTVPVAQSSENNNTFLPLKDAVLECTG